MRHPDAGVALSKSILVPIPKSTKKSLNQSDNYRSIAISSIVGKCLDNIILVKHDKILQSDDLQFGFKRNHSTTQCTYVLNEVVDHYLRGGSRVFVVLLDASRAFDRVHYGKLFNLLIDRKMCCANAKLLLSMYTSQSLMVRWMSGISRSFECRNGVKQGGVLSPILFSIVIDVLLQRLRVCGVGCYLGHVFSGAVSYADDVSLMAPSISGAQKMLDECSKFAREFHLLFNCSKSQLLVFGSSNPSTRQLILNDAPIPLVSFATHLGHVIGEGASQRNLEKTMCDLTIRANMLGRNYSFVDFDHLRLLFHSYCNSYYGSQFWDNSKMNQLCVCWRKCIRRIFMLNTRTHSVFLPHIVNQMPPDLTCLIRVATFYMSLFCSSNSVVNMCRKISITGSSVFDENLRLLLYRMNMNTFIMDDLCTKGTITKHCKNVLSLHSVPPDEILAVAYTVIELCRCRTNDWSCGLNDNDISVFLTYLCTGTC